MTPDFRPAQLRQIAADLVGDAQVLAGSGLLRPVRPDRLLGMGFALGRYGLTLPAGYGAAAASDPDAAALIDDDGPVTYRELHQRTDGIAGALRARGLVAGDAVGVLARNGRGFVEAVLGASKAGCDLVYLNTGFSSRQLSDVVAREGVRLVIADGDLASLCDPELGVVLTWELSALAAGQHAPLRPGHASRHVLMTSGTTGAPKGAARSAAGLDVPLAILSRIPLRRREVTVVTCPLFHAWGFVHLALGMLLSSTLVLSKAFDAEQTLAAVEEHRASTLITVPVLLTRLLDAYDDAADRPDLDSLRILAVSGSALPVPLGRRALDTFGDVVYDLYGSTEVGYAAIATPADLRSAPGTVGKPPRGVTVALLDAAGDPVAEGETGRIFVGSGISFGGYTSGEDKQRVAGLLSSGDMGRFDAEGRLYVVGRDDDMIVTGGENVFPGEIEDVLREHPSVADVCVVGVPDEAYGARLVAHVVPATGAEVDLDTLKSHVREHLARFKAPRQIVVCAELPRNATGKLLRKDLVAATPTD